MLQPRTVPSYGPAVIARPTRPVGGVMTSATRALGCACRGAARAPWSSTAPQLTPAPVNVPPNAGTLWDVHVRIFNSCLSKTGCLPWIHAN